MPQSTRPIIGITTYVEPASWAVVARRPGRARAARLRPPGRPTPAACRCSSRRCPADATRRRRPGGARPARRADPGRWGRRRAEPVRRRAAPERAGVRGRTATAASSSSRRQSAELGPAGARRLPGDAGHGGRGRRRPGAAPARRRRHRRALARARRLRPARGADRPGLAAGRRARRAGGGRDVPPPGRRHRTPAWRRRPGPTTACSRRSRTRTRPSGSACSGIPRWARTRGCSRRSSRPPRHAPGARAPSACLSRSCRRTTTSRPPPGRIAGVAHRTPVLTSRQLDEELGLQVFFKAENLQRMGAFKFRGAFNTLARLTAEQRRAGVVAYSSGNHAQAVALAARLLGPARDDRHAAGRARRARWRPRAGTAGRS